MHPPHAIRRQEQHMQSGGACRVCIAFCRPSSVRCQQTMMRAVCGLAEATSWARCPRQSRCRTFRRRRGCPPPAGPPPTAPTPAGSSSRGSRSPATARCSTAAAGAAAAPGRPGRRGSRRPPSRTRQPRTPPAPDGAARRQLVTLTATPGLGCRQKNRTPGWRLNVLPGGRERRRCRLRFENKRGLLSLNTCRPLFIWSNEVLLWSPQLARRLLGTWITSNRRLTVRFLGFLPWNLCQQRSGANDAP